MMNWLQGFLQKRHLESRNLRPRIRMQEMPEAVYVIGDVHGCLSQLRCLEARIAADRSMIDGRALVVYLGDLVDRGPDSAGVLEHLLTPANPGFGRVALCGNHEQMFLDFLSSPSIKSAWLQSGGIETLRSYGIEINGTTKSRHLRLQLETLIPDEHRVFLEELPLSLELPSYFLTHAGIDPSRTLSDQRDSDLLSIRRGFVDYSGPLEKCVVHGHTPVTDVQISSHRISVDTGAYGTGKLCAVRLSKEASPKVFCSGNGIQGK
jgi:Calcineurin-like phosphoesterase